MGPSGILAVLSKTFKHAVFSLTTYINMLESNFPLLSYSSKHFKAKNSEGPQFWGFFSLCPTMQYGEQTMVQLMPTLERK